MLDVDITVVFEMIGYFVLLLLLNILLYKPVLKILRRREDLIGGTFKKASDMDKKVDEGLADYESRIKEVSLKGYEENSKLKQAAIEEESRMIESAAVEISADLAEKRRDMLGDKRTAIAGLKADMGSISRVVAEKLLDRRLLGALLMVALSLLPVLVMASTDGDAEGRTASNLLWKGINFAILLLGIYIVWRKSIKGMFTKRRVEIQNGLEEAKAAKEAAEKKVEDYKGKLSSLELRLEEAAKEIRREWEVERERVMADSRVAIERLKGQASFTLAQEVKKARQEVRREAAVLAVDMARELLGKELNAEDQERLVKVSIEKLRLN
jgi:F-type H+-transporting ATPase subunit b